MLNVQESPPTGSLVSQLLPNRCLHAEIGSLSGERPGPTQLSGNTRLPVSCLANRRPRAEFESTRASSEGLGQWKQTLATGGLSIEAA